MRPSMRAWIEAHQDLLKALGVASIAMLVASVVIAPWLVARVRADFFTRPPTPRTRGVLGWIVLVVQNAVGAVLVLAGVAMLVLPGQGLLTILVGLALITGPGKRKLELAIVRRAPIRKSIQWLRRKAGKPPLEIPD